MESSCPLLKKQLPQKCSSCLLLKKQIKNKYFSCLLFLTTTISYILGDFIWAKESEWPSIVGSLCGNKVLIRGNHDPKQFSAATKRMSQEITDLKEIKDSGKHVVMCHYPIPFFRASFASTAFMLYGHVHQTIEYEYIAKLRREVKANSTGYGTPNGNFINVGCMMPYMDYTPRTLDEIIEGDARYHEENPDAL